MKVCVFCGVGEINPPRRKLCDDCFDNKRSVYMKNYRRNNPDIDRMYYQMNRDSLLHKMQIFRTENREHVNAQQRERYKNNPIPSRENSKKYYHNNKEKCKARNAINQRIWQKQNPERTSYLSMRYHARKKDAEGNHSFESWMRLLNAVGGVCPACGNHTKLQEEHIVPLNIGGSDYIYNIQPLCKSCNTSKGQSVILFQPERRGAMQNILEFADKMNMQVVDNGCCVELKHAEGGVVA